MAPYRLSLLLLLLLKHFCHFILKDHIDGVVGVFFGHLFVGDRSDGFVFGGCMGKGSFELDFFDFFDIFVVVLQVV